MPTKSQSSGRHTEKNKTVIHDNFGSTCITDDNSDIKSHSSGTCEAGFPCCPGLNRSRNPS